MAAFLRDFAEKLGHCVREHHIHALVLVAPAKVLGLIRPYLSKTTRQVLVAELDRDYVKMPLYEIERHIAVLPYHNQMLGH
jgi:protein required for attachment to host cells